MAGLIFRFVSRALARPQVQRLGLTARTRPSDDHTGSPLRCNANLQSRPSVANLPRIHPTVKGLPVS